MLESEENQDENKSFLEKINFSTKNYILSLIIIGLVGLSLRLYYFPFGLPIAGDGSDYFWYAIDMSVLGNFPPGYTFPNNGWSAFLSIFFSIFHFDNVLDYMTLQRMLSVVISVLTIIPVFLLCTRFFNKLYSLFGAALFVFEPRMLKNSLLGITEPLYILLVATTLFCFLSKNNKVIYISFALAALFSIVRYEGLVIIFPLSIMFFVRFRKDRIVIPKYLLALAIFILVLLPMAMIRLETIGNDGLLSNTLAAPRYYQTISQNESNQLKIFEFIIIGIINLVKFSGWIMIPIFIFFVPYGIFMIFKNRNDKKITIIITTFFLLMPAFYAYSREIQDTRYLYVIFPILSILSIYTIMKINSRLNKPKIIFMFLMISILFGSWLFFDYNKIDYGHEKEALNIAADVTDLTSVINNYYPESKYIRYHYLKDLEKFPVLESTLVSKIKILAIEKSNSIEEYIKLGRNYGLTHLVVDGNNARPPILNDVFYNEEKYPYLTILNYKLRN